MNGELMHHAGTCNIETELKVIFGPQERINFEDLRSRAQIHTI
jgi:hypothetical protein